MDVCDAATLPRGGDDAAVDARDVDDGDAPLPPSLRLLLLRGTRAISRCDFNGNCVFVTIL
jgi:hypothetical protein